MENLTGPTELGTLPLRNSVLFPHAIMPISVGRRKTLNLLDDVVNDSKMIAVVSQRDPAVDDPDPSGMYRLGTAARILKVVKLSEGNVNLIIQGIRRLRVDRFTATEPFMKAVVTSLDEITETGVEQEALDHAREVLRRGRLLLEERGVGVQVAVVEAVHDLAIEDRLEILEVEDHPRDGIRLSPEGHLEPVVVPVALGIATEPLGVLLGGEIVQPIAERGREMDRSGDADHGLIP